MRTTPILLLSILTIATVLAPVASAQSTTQRMDVSLQGFVDDPALGTNRILPETNVAKVRVDALLNVNMFNRASTCSTPVQIDFAVIGPAYATAVMAPSSRTMIIPGPTTSGSQSTWQSMPVSAVLEITVGREAPAFVDGLYQVTMQARSQPSVQGGTSSCDLGNSAQASATYRLKNDYTPRTSVEAADLFAKAGPNQKVTFPITLSNIGNGPSRVKVMLQASETDAFRAFSAGPEIRLGSLQGSGGQSTRTILVEVTTPATWGYTNDLSTLTATIVTTYDGVAPGTTFQETSDITFTVQTQGAYVALFGLPTFLGVPLVLALAAVAGAYGRKGITTMRDRRRERKADRLGAEGFDEESAGEDIEFGDPQTDQTTTDRDLIAIKCPRCSTPTRAPRGSRPVCANCGFS